MAGDGHGPSRKAPELRGEGKMETCFCGRGVLSANQELFGGRAGEQRCALAVGTCWEVEANSEIAFVAPGQGWAVLGEGCCLAAVGEQGHAGPQPLSKKLALFWGSRQGEESLSRVYFGHCGC